MTPHAWAVAVAEPQTRRSAGARYAPLLGVPGCRASVVRLTGVLERELTSRLVSIAAAGHVTRGTQRVRSPAFEIFSRSQTHLLVAVVDIVDLAAAAHLWGSLEGVFLALVVAVIPGHRPG